MSPRNFFENSELRIPSENGVYYNGESKIWALRHSGAGAPRFLSALVPDPQSQIIVPPPIPPHRAWTIMQATASILVIEDNHSDPQGSQTVRSVAYRFEG